MKALLLRWSAIACAAGMLLSSGCVVPDGGYGYAAAGPDYYEPYGVAYGGWGPGYGVAPVRGGYRGPGRRVERGAPHAYRPAPASRSVPSIPSRARSGGRRSR